MTRKLTIRSKLAAALAVPLLAVAALVARQVADSQDTTEGTPTILIGAGVGVLALTLLLFWLANRMITQPLRTFADEAQAMATERLPEAVDAVRSSPADMEFSAPRLEPIVMRGGTELTAAVDALNAVQASALGLAVEQAVLRRNVSDSFVNLGRRNQNLLARQIDLISKLEADETDADTLEALFQLDHLATRMRRNAESLLVLAGQEPPRLWNKPVGIGDVVRAAMGEVEHYARVRLHPSSDDTTIAGAAVTDVSHLLAELLENALTFSPPDSTVDLYARHGDDGYLVTITDDGIGMPTEDMERANARLRTSEVFAIAPSRYLGHYVVANLAARHDIRVQLSPSPSGGVLATVVLSPSVLASGAPVATRRAAAAFVPVRETALDAVVSPEPIVIPDPEPLVRSEPEPLPEPAAVAPAPGPDPEPVPAPPVAPATVPTMGARGAFAALLFERPSASEPHDEAPTDVLPEPEPEPEPAAAAVAEPAPEPVEGIDQDALAATLSGAAPIQDDLLPRYEALAPPRRNGRRGRKAGPRVAEVPAQVMRIAAAAPPLPPAPVAEAPVEPGAPGPAAAPGEAPTYAVRAFGDIAAAPSAPSLPRRADATTTRAPVPEPVAAPDEDAPAESAAEMSRNYALFAAFRAATDLGRADAGHGGGS
ncbi:MAG: sensor histidine kinase [Actinomycetota bacterium]